MVEKEYEAESSLIGEDQSQKKKPITIWPLLGEDQSQKNIKISCKCHYTCAGAG